MCSCMCMYTRKVNQESWTLAMWSVHLIEGMRWQSHPCNMCSSQKHPSWADNATFLPEWPHCFFLNVLSVPLVHATSTGSPPRVHQLGHSLAVQFLLGSEKWWWFFFFLIAKTFSILGSNKVCCRCRLHFQTSCSLQRYASKEPWAEFWGRSFEIQTKRNLFLSSWGKVWKLH